MQTLDEMLSLNLLTPDQHYEISAWTHHAKTPEKSWKCRRICGGRWSWRAC